MTDNKEELNKLYEEERALYGKIFEDAFWKLNQETRDKFFTIFEKINKLKDD